MIYYVVALIQLIIYSSYTLIEHLSGKDHLFYNFFMFIVFFYLSFMIAKYYLKTIKKTVTITTTSLVSYLLIHQGLSLFL